MAHSIKVQWLSTPEVHDYPAAQSYLSLVYDRKTTAGIIARLRRAPAVQFKAKDLFRASALALLSETNFHVRKDREKLTAGEKLSPLLLVRDAAHGRVIIADGYHRLCAVYSLDEDAVIPCRIV
jgi:hypothetical protein